ncbi:MAG: SpoIID/LytB domain-containing protein, partial [Firmicutes bacterium]|nr:SpoIID/LytB domain-containing protein [Bacillota bacterium]
LLCGGIFSSAMAYEMPDTVRIGLSACKNAESITLYNESILIGAGEGERTYFEAELKGSAGYIVRIPSAYYVDIGERFRDFDAAKQCADELIDSGYNAAPAYISSETFGVYATDADDASEAAYLADDIWEDFRYDAEAIGKGGSAVEIYAAGDILFVGGPDTVLRIGTSGESLMLPGKEYRGELEFVRTSGGNINAVNVVDIEEYLYSVVPAEMGYTAPEEALKAQAVAARTYTADQMGLHSGDGYDLCDTTHCQVYSGVSGERSASTNAVDATRGKIMTYDGKPINAVYSASSGGYTESSENAWVEAVGYLRGVPDRFSENTNVWERTYTASELEAILAADGKDIGDIENVAITKSQNSRAQELTFIGTRSSVSYTKEKIRTLFSSDSRGSLPSRLFTVNGNEHSNANTNANGNSSGNNYSGAEPLYSVSGRLSDGFYAVDSEGNVDTPKMPFILGAENEKRQFAETSEVREISVEEGNYDVFVFSGSGYGHGVGMSQNGAMQMAREGYEYTEILSHYYTGVRIE